MCNEALHKQSAMKRFMCMNILNRNVFVTQRTVTKLRSFETSSLHRVRKALRSATLKRSR